jgi:hypothetical protein
VLKWTNALQLISMRCLQSNGKKTSDKENKCQHR